MMSFLHKALDATTMYRVVLYALTAIIACAFVLSAVGTLSYAPVPLLASLCAILAATLAAHYVLTWVSRAPSNVESSYITALILFLILTPPETARDAGTIALIAATAIVLKYLVRLRFRHVFNPAALVLVIFGIAGYTGVEWWVGSRYVFPVVAVAGLLVVVKTRRMPLFLAYVIASTACVAAYFYDAGPLSDTLVRHFLSWPTIFFAAFMLTEPLALPSTHRLQYVYAAIAALLGSIPFTLGPVHGTPELALLAANLLTFFVDKPERLVLSFTERKEVGKDTFEYFFTPRTPCMHLPGQYLEWTLPHANADTRGVRRYFTIASAPGASHVSFAVRHVAGQSTWKKELERMQPGAQLFATQRAGDFTLRAGAPLHVWIAGGIGITPFMSMIRHAQATGTQIPALLFYCNKSEGDTAFMDEIAAAEKVGVRTVCVLSESASSSNTPHETGFITKDMMARHVPEWQKATFYISGPPGLVAAYEKLLSTMGVPRARVVTDYFPGLA